MALEGGVDIATLGLRVDGREVRRAKSDLDELTAAGARAEVQADRLGDRFDRGFRRHADAAAQYRRAAEERIRTERELLEVVEEEQAALGSFAAGAAFSVAVVAGMSAIAFAFREITREARESRQELDRNLETLRELATEQGIQSRGGGLRIALEAAQAEASRIAAELRAREIVPGGDLLQARGTAGVVSAGPLRERLRELNELVRAGLIELEGEEEASRARRRRADLRWRNEGRAIRERLAEEARQLELRLIRQRWRAEDREIEFNLRLILEKEKIGRDAIAKVVEETNERIADEQERRRQAELDAIAELERARERSLDALVRGLYNVGRAYGGVADQVLSLTAAVISLEKAPFETRRDKAVALGGAALTGAGFGASAGPGLGLIGGAAGGFVTAGVPGAIVGGVSGIVSGLATEAGRARRAQAEWERVFSSFEQLFLPSNTMRDGLQRLEAAYRQAVDATNAASRNSFTLSLRLEEVNEQYLENIERLREQVALERERYRDDLEVRRLRAIGDDEAARALELQIRHEAELRELLRNTIDPLTISMLLETQAAERAALATNQLTNELDRLFTALNAPSGLNLPLYFNRAGTAPSGGGGGGIGGGGGMLEGGIIIQSGAIVVSGTSNPQEAAREVIRELKREASRGGGDPLRSTTR